MPTDSVRNVNDFKNTPSLAPAIYVSVDVNVERYNYLVISGSAASEQFRPAINSLPNIRVGDPPPPLPTPMFLLNSDSRNCKVNVTFTGCENNFLLDAGHGGRGNVTVRRNDRVKLVDSQMGESDVQV